MKRTNKAGNLRFRKGLRFELLEARQLLASDLSNVFLFEGYEAVPNELLVQYRPQSAATPGKLILPPIDVTIAENIHTKTMQANGVGILQRVTLGSGVDMKAAIEEFKKNPDVLYAEPNYIYHPAVISNDTHYLNRNLWGMYSNDSPSAIGPVGTTNPFGSQAEKAWNENTIGSKNVVIGVIDEGVQVPHPDLIDNMWVNPFEIPGNGADDDGNGYKDDIHGWDFYNDDNSVYDGTSDDHGTHVAGTIGAKGGNNAGVAGVAWNVTMISAKFLGAGGGTTAGAIKSVDYLTDLKTRHGMNIVASSNSWGGGGYSQALLDAIIRSANKDILFVAAAGNASSNNDVSPFYPATYSTVIGTPSQPPASYEAVISVASITNTGAMSGFSSYGATTVDIGAPGSDIWSTLPSSTYGSYSGTSMATPHVSGAIALYASTQPVGTSAASIRQAILESATPTPSLAGKTVTGGRLNVFEAVRAKPSILVSEPSPSATTTEAGGEISFTVVLVAAPTADVFIPISSSDETEGILSVNQLLFTPLNWNTPQTVTVKGLDDLIDDGDINYKVIMGVASSTDKKYDGIKPIDVVLFNQDDDISGVDVSPPSSPFTTEAGGSVTFVVRLTSEPLASVTIPITSSDTTEGTVSSSSLVFTPSNWNIPQTVTVTGVDDAIYDGNISYAINLWTARSADLIYNTVNPKDVLLTNLDNESAPSKFFVVDDGTVNRNYGYDGGGNSTGNFVLTNANAAPKGMATNASGNRVWVVDSNRTVYVYSNSGLLLGSWAAGGMPSNAVVEGIATNGTHIWIVDSGSDRVYYYPNAAARNVGTQNPTSNFLLNGANRNPKDIVTDGNSIWVVNDTTSDRVFRYSMSGVLQTSWAISTENASPTGIAIDPSNKSSDIWIVDNGTDRIYRYASARTLTEPVMASSFPLSVANTNPQGLINSPSGLWYAPIDGSISTAPLGTKQTNATVQRDQVFSVADREAFALGAAIAPSNAKPSQPQSAIPSAIGGAKSSTTKQSSTKLTALSVREQVFADFGSDLS